MVFCPTDGTSLRMDESGGDLIGTVIADRYLVGKLLGEGGMGKVYLATHVRLPQKAAIKVLHHDMVKDAGAVARFNREAANAARIEHDRVARVFDFGETSDGLVYIAMEFVPGSTLRDVLDESGRLPPVRAANLVYQVAEGLDAAHRLSIVHRDLKPDNILVITDDAGVDRCKVVDFGIAKLTNGSETQLTQMGMLVGTPDYMSPEQVLGEQLDGRSDVYALALVAYEMFSGALTFDGSTPERKLTARLIQDPRPLSEVAPDVDWPPALQAAFDHALLREPDARTATAVEFADAIVNAVEAWTGVSVLRARTPMSTPAIVSAANESTSSLARPTPSSVPTAGGARSTPPVSSRPATPGAGTSASKPAIPEPKPKTTPWAAVAGVVLMIGAAGAYFAFGRDGAGDAVTPSASGTSTDTNSTAPVTQSGGAPTKPSAPKTSAPTTAAPLSPSGATMANVPPVGSVPAVQGGVSAADAAAAHAELEEIRTMLSTAPDGTEPLVGTRAVPQLNQVMPRLITQTDSAWAYLALATAHAYAERPDRSCEPYRMAKRLATTPAQRAQIDGLAAALTCAP
ncbi:MAG: protein kinase [Gemmatimonas sp.]